MREFFDEVRDFKRRLALVEDRPQERQPSPQTASRLTELPAHPFRVPDAVEIEEQERRYPKNPEQPSTCPTALSLTITINSLAFCTGCLGPDVNGNWFKVTSLTLGSPKTVTRPDVFSAWTLPAAGSAGVTSYGPTGDCSDPGASTTVDVNIVVECSSGILRPTISFIIPGTSQQSNLFTGSGLINVAIANTNSCNSTAGGGVGSGHAGTTTVSP